MAAKMETDAEKPMDEVAQDNVLELCRLHPDGVNEAMLKKSFPDFALEVLAGAINQLIAYGRLELIQKGSDYLYRAVSAEEHEKKVKLVGLNEEDMLTFQLIEASGEKGIWIKDLQHRSGIHSVSLTKTIKRLSSRQLIKMFKPANSKTRKMYILFELTPKVEGSKWYTDREFDAEFISVLNRTCYSFIDKETKQGHAVTLEEVTAYVAARGISKVSLDSEHIVSILNSLVYDGKIVEVDSQLEDGVKVFKSVPKMSVKLNGFTEIPCGMCPVFSECSEDGVISPATCVYMEEWLW